MSLSPGFLELARKLVAANTVSANGTKAAADILQPLFEHVGLNVRRQVVDGIHVNLLAGPGGDASWAGGVLLVTHLDTVPAGPGWKTDPFSLALSTTSSCDLAERIDAAHRTAVAPRG